MRRRVLVFASLLLLGIGALAGCGQKGPLFLPAKPAAPASAASAAAPPAPAAPAPASSSHH